jgi:hypothetical protein
MSKKKTAITQAIERCDYWIKFNESELEKCKTGGYAHSVSVKILCYQTMKRELEQLLPTEREQIINAHSEGMAYEACEEDSLPAQQYYEKTYGE